MKPEYDRGPWWWRLRCWASQKMLEVGAALEPDDKSSVSWSDDQYVYYDTARRGPDE